MGAFGKKIKLQVVSISDGSITVTRSPRLKLVISPLTSHAQFEELLVKHLNALYSTAVRLTGSREEAQDLVQETALRAFIGFHQLQDVEKVKSWFLQILINTFRNKYKKEKHGPTIIDIELSVELLASASTTPYDQEHVLGRLLEDEVEEALQKLPVEFRSVIILSALEDCDYQEISEILGCPPGTVASRLFRARQLLREYLESYAKRHGLL